MKLALSLRMIFQPFPQLRIFGQVHCSIHPGAADDAVIEVRIMVPKLDLAASRAARSVIVLLQILSSDTKVGEIFSWNRKLSMGIPILFTFPIGVLSLKLCSLLGIKVKMRIRVRFDDGHWVIGNLSAWGA